MLPSKYGTGMFSRRPEKQQSSAVYKLNTTYLSSVRTVLSAGELRRGQSAVLFRESPVSVDHLLA